MPRAAAPPPPRRRIALPIVLGAVALVLSFGIGRWTAPDETPPAVAEAERAAPPAPTQWEPVTPAPAPAQAVAEAAPPVAAAPAAAPARPVVLTPEIANRVNREATAKLEGLRDQVVATCLPSAGAAKGRKRASVTYNITFDAQGREIARGITEDRRAPAGGEFTKCLRQLQRAPISVSPPGTNVALSIAVTYP